MKTNIYTPGNLNPDFLNFEIGQKVKVTILSQGNREYIGIVHSFPRNSNPETDIRICIRPDKSIDEKNNWFGSITISAENNYYGNLHISEALIETYEIKYN